MNKRRGLKVQCDVRMKEGGYDGGRWDWKCRLEQRDQLTGQWWAGRGFMEKQGPSAAQLQECRQQGIYQETPKSLPHIHIPSQKVTRIVFHQKRNKSRQWKVWEKENLTQKRGGGKQKMTSVRWALNAVVPESSRMTSPGRHEEMCWSITWRVWLWENIFWKDFIIHLDNSGGK